MKFYKNKFVFICLMKGEFWVRFVILKNYKYDGFRVINRKSKKMRFSERNGYVKTFNILKYNFKTLRPYKI